MEAVFAAYGEAAYYAHLMEYDLVSVWMLDSVSQGVSRSRQDLVLFQGDWSKRTFGQLLAPLQKSHLIPNEIKRFLEQLRLTRNRLMHRFFVEVAQDLKTDEGRTSAVDVLRQMNSVMEKGEQFISDMLDTYLKDLGVDSDGIRKKVLQEVLDADI